MVLRRKGSGADGWRTSDDRPGLWEDLVRRVKDAAFVLVSLVRPHRHSERASASDVRLQLIEFAASPLGRVLIALVGVQLAWLLLAT